jgi:hypothetical protein
MDSYEVSNENKTITILFDEAIENNKRSESELKRQIKLASNGKFYKSLASKDTVSIEDNKLIITLSKPITGSSNTVKITKNSLKDLAGNVIASDLITSPIQALDVDAPIYQGSTLSEDNKEVTLIFNEDIYSDESELKDVVQLAADGKDFGSLEEEDSVEIVDNKLVINLDEGLRGSTNVIQLEEGALKDNADNLLSEPVVTKAVKASDIYAPEYQYSTVKNSNKTVTLFFDENIENITGSSAALKSSISFSGNKLSDRDRVSIRSNTLTITFADAITGTNELQIDAGILSDREDNILSEPVTAEIVAADIEAPEYVESNISNENKTVTLVFNEAIATFKSAYSLKASVKISTDGGSFKSLDRDDQVSIIGNQLVIKLAKPLAGKQIEVKVSSNTLKDLADNRVRGEIVTGTLKIDPPVDTPPTVSGISITDRNGETLQGNVEGNTITLNGIKRDAKYVTGTLTLSENAKLNLRGIEVMVPQGSNFISLLMQLFAMSNGSVSGSTFLDHLNNKSITLTDESGNVTTYTLEFTEASSSN